MGCGLEKSFVHRSKTSHKSSHRRKTLCRKSAVNWRLGYDWVGCYKGSWWRRRRLQYDGCDTRTWDLISETSFRSHKCVRVFDQTSLYLSSKSKSSGGGGGVGVLLLLLKLEDLFVKTHFSDSSKKGTVGGSPIIKKARFRAHFRLTGIFGTTCIFGTLFFYCLYWLIIV